MIKIAIIGAGGMAHVHAERFGAIRESKLMAVCDVVSERAKAFAGKYGRALTGGINRTHSGRICSNLE